jgi:hypothetical protein
MAPKAHDQTTIGSRCKKVVQNPAMCMCVYAGGDVSREKKSEERVAKDQKNKKKKTKKKQKEKKGKREIPPRSREIKGEREEKKNSESPL